MPIKRKIPLVTAIAALGGGIWLASDVFYRNDNAPFDDLSWEDKAKLAISGIGVAFSMGGVFVGALAWA